MKIREIRTWVLRHELPEAEVFGSSKGWHTVRQALVVEILTEEGLSGFGEAYGPPAVNRTLVDEVYAPRLVGKNALEHARSEEHTSELQSLTNLVCRLLLEKKK